jgi:hypothetical protein
MESYDEQEHNKLRKDKEDLLAKHKAASYDKQLARLTALAKGRIYSDDSDEEGDGSDEEGDGSDADDDETGATEGLATGATAWVTDGDILVVRQHHDTLRSGRAHYAHSDSDREMDYYAAEQQVVRLLLLQFANDASGHRRSNLLGQILDEGASGCYICNKNRNHWVALFFDGVSREVLYFDPLGNEIDDKLCTAIIKATDAAVQTWTHNDWSSAKVQCDGYNCGIWCLLVEKCFVEWLSTSGTGGSFADSLRSSTSQLNSATATTIAELRTVCTNIAVAHENNLTQTMVNRYFAQQLGHQAMLDFDVKAFQILPDDIALQVSMAESLSEFLRPSPVATPGLVTQPPGPPEPSTASTGVVATAVAVAVGAAAAGAAAAGAARAAAAAAVPAQDDTNTDEIDDLDELLLSASSMTQADQGDTDDSMALDIDDIDLSGLPGMDDMEWHG